MTGSQHLVVGIRIFGCGSLIRFPMIILVTRCWRDTPRMLSSWNGFPTKKINQLVQVMITQSGYGRAKMTTTSVSKCQKAINLQFGMCRLWASSCSLSDRTALSSSGLLRVRIRNMGSNEYTRGYIFCPFTPRASSTKSISAQEVVITKSVSCPQIPSKFHSKNMWSAFLYAK